MGCCEPNQNDLMAVSPEILQTGAVQLCCQSAALRLHAEQREAGLLGVADGPPAADWPLYAFLAKHDLDSCQGRRRRLACCQSAGTGPAKEHQLPFDVLTTADAVSHPAAIH